MATKKYLKSRKASRKSRKAQRKSLKSRKSRRVSRRHRMRGGNTMMDSLKQGMTYMANVPMLKGGMAPYPGSVDDSALPVALRGAAHLSGQDAAYAAIAGMQDGGKRRRRIARKSKRTAHRKTMKGRKRTGKSRRSRSRKQRGGMASLSEPVMLLPAELEAKAGLHPEWKLF
jgi:hypothetical protein